MGSRLYGFVCVVCAGGRLPGAIISPAPMLMSTSASDGGSSHTVALLENSRLTKKNLDLAEEVAKLTRQLGQGQEELAESRVQTVNLKQQVEAAHAEVDEERK